jgi:hypothetical protein
VGNVSYLAQIPWTCLHGLSDFNKKDGWKGQIDQISLGASVGKKIDSVDPRRVHEVALLRYLVDGMTIRKLIRCVAASSIRQIADRYIPETPEHPGDD